jgi:hypothetical protein
MFFKILNNIRKKPPHVKSAIAFAISAGFTFVVGTVWMVSYAEYISESTKDNFKEKTFEPITKISAIVSEGVGHMMDLKKVFNDDAANLTATTTQLMLNSAASSDVESNIEIPASTSMEDLIQ